MLTETDPGSNQVLRHTALFMFKEDTTEEQVLRALKGLAYLSYGCPSVQAVDFGRDLLGGSTKLREVKPWLRTPLWHARREGPPSNFDMALNLDFDNKDGLDAYNKDDVHHEVGEYNASVCRGEFTARVDWWYDGPPRIERGRVRHTSLFLWDENATASQKDQVKAAFSSLSASVPGVRSVLTGDNIGTHATDYDLIVDVILDDREGAKAFIEHPAQVEAVALAAAATKFEWTARITHTSSLG